MFLWGRIIGVTLAGALLALPLAAQTSGPKPAESKPSKPAEAPKAPVIPLEIKKDFYKRQLAAQTAQAVAKTTQDELQQTVQDAAKVCGTEWLLSLDQDQELVCVAKPAAKPGGGPASGPSAAKKP